jgi:ABC-type dipeptide/oligopeptide/nickel transport system ATPase component
LTLICLEGASGVGKSTTCLEIMTLYNASVIPEVNELFERPETASKYWYFEKQVERWQLAQEKLKKHELVVLDGDIFQPLWYNWSYDFQIFGQTIDQIKDYFLNQIKNGNIGFPDSYSLLFIEET